VVQAVEWARLPGAAHLAMLLCKGSPSEAAHVHTHDVRLPLPDLAPVVIWYLRAGCGERALLLGPGTYPHL